MAFSGRVSAGGLHLRVDNTGIKIMGEGELKSSKHGASYRRRWRKVHLGLNTDVSDIRAFRLAFPENHSSSPSRNGASGSKPHVSGYTIRNNGPLGSSSRSSSRLFSTGTRQGASARNRRSTQSVYSPPSKHLSNRGPCSLTPYMSQITLSVSCVQSLACRISSSIPTPPTVIQNNYLCPKILTLRLTVIVLDKLYASQKAVPR
jgi:hypothetical protein